MELPGWVATSVKNARSAASRVKEASASVPWLRVGGLSTLAIAGFAVAASSAQVSGQAVVPVPVPVVSAATAQADMGQLNLVTVMRPPTQYRIAPSAAVAPPPPGILMAPGGLGIPKIALDAYQNAERMMAKAEPGCGVSWNLLAGIGRIESGHANNGATDVKGRVIRPIYGPTLDGTLPGNEVIIDHEESRTQGSQVYVRAIGPMQFLPSTWSRYASDGDGDGKADPQNVFDASLAAARYLCSGGLNLRDHSQVMSAILRYNNSVAYAQNVLAWAAGYATGVIPLNLPPLTAADVAPERKAHLGGESRGLGPGSAIDVAGLSPNDPLAQLPIVNPLTPDRVTVAGLPGATPPAPEAPQAPCMFFCAPQPPPAEPFNPFAPPPPPAEPFNPFAPNQAPQPFNPFAPPPPPVELGPAPGPAHAPAAPKP
ncbi:lytic transglycosylase domain-containing protein [Mycobacteroides franklinii]|uniref:lytic transglycosylase domain-containing protein n=1 Tax=Mycobacteroides franklinii TaxID=948102 RepID=UPI0009938C09|nr:lytic murein transglycosylase [Mycobacteroides franklinii]